MRMVRLEGALSEQELTLVAVLASGDIGGPERLA